MLKFICFFIIGFMVVGCQIDKGVDVKKGIYQSVNEDKAILLQNGKDKRYCAMCGMDLVMYYKTNHAAVYKNKNYQYCSIHCLEEHLGRGVTLKNPLVVDVKTLKFMSVGDAFYVVGSKKPATMSRISKYAFSSLKDAKEFQLRFGGEIMNFEGARQKALQDFKFKRKY
jgi:nitrous oxide reductase accessory protein NosL